MGVTIGDNEPVDQALLVEVLELREGLERARAAPAELARLEAVMRGREQRELSRAGAALDAAVEASGSARDAALADAKAACLALRYVRRYLEAARDAADEEVA
jgi:hypothetical protein